MSQRRLVMMETSYDLGREALIQYMTQTHGVNKSLIEATEEWFRELCIKAVADRFKFLTWDDWEFIYSDAIEVLDCRDRFGRDSYM